jgi:hypothetical protein
LEWRPALIPFHIRLHQGEDCLSWWPKEVIRDWSRINGHQLNDNSAGNNDELDVLSGAELELALA